MKILQKIPNVHKQKICTVIHKKREIPKKVLVLTREYEIQTVITQTFSCKSK